MNKGLRPDPRTMPVTKEYEDGFERTFGQPDEKAKGGRFKWSKELGKLIEVGGEEDISFAKDSGIMVDRFMEGAVATDGTDISSRRKRREYMRARGVTEASDYGSDYKERVEASKDRAETRSIRESVEKTLYKLYKP